MTKSTHSTARRRPTTGGTAESLATPAFIDPTTLPDEYAMRVRGDCLAPAINAGDAVLFDRRQPFDAGDLVGVFLKPECFAPGSTNVGLKRIVMNMMPGVTYPYKAHPDSNVMPCSSVSRTIPTGSTPSRQTRSLPFTAAWGWCLKT